MNSRIPTTDFKTNNKSRRRPAAVTIAESLEPRILLAHDAINPIAYELADFDRSGHLEAADIDLLSLAVRRGASDSTFDVNQDGHVNRADRQYWVNVVRRTYFGDSTLNGLFDTSDLIVVFQAGRYEDGQSNNASWEQGDWDGDGDFGTSDLIVAFQDGGFEQKFRSLSLPTPRLASEFDSGLPGDATTYSASVAVEGHTDPFVVVALDGMEVKTYADHEGRFRLDNISLAIGANELVISSLDMNGSRASATLTLQRLPSTSEEKFAYAPWGKTVDFETLYPEIPRSLITALLPAGVTRHQLLGVAPIKNEAIEPVPIKPFVDGTIEETEQEPSNTSGLNDSVATAEPISGFGTGLGDVSAAVVSGVLIPISTELHPVEDDGDIRKATETSPHLAKGTSVFAVGQIGDGPFGSGAVGTGDFDFYAVRGLKKDQRLTIDINTPESSTLDSFIFVWNSTGQTVDVNDDDNFSGDSYLEFVAQADGDYFVSVAGFGSFGPVDPFDSASGFGADSEGAYEIILSIDVAPDIDFYSVDLAPGDILGATVLHGASHLTLRDPSGNTLMGSGQDGSFAFPESSPLPGGGNATLNWVIDTSGTYTIAVDGGVGAYELQLAAFRPRLESQPRGVHQVLFLDFDGAELDAFETFDIGNSKAQLSPLSSFLSGWGLTESDENAVIDAITATVVENFLDIGLSGNNGDRSTDGVDGHYEIEIVTSRDARDAFGFPVELFGQPNVSRVIIGGSIQELGVETIGLSQSIDVGNFDTRESSVVLLDLLSTPASNPNSLNRYGLAPGTSIIDLIGVAVGNIAAHEAGHFFANWHTQQLNSVTNLMDQGGNPDNTIGVGPDRVFGTSDDIDVDFGRDVFVPNEGFTGTEDTLNAIAFGLTSGTVDTGMKVVGSSPRDNEQLNSRPTAFALDFIDSYESSTGISPGSLVVNGNSADRVELTSDRRLTFHFDSSPVTRQGLQTMALAEGSVVRARDGDPVEPFTANFGFDAELMRIVEVRPADEFIELPLNRIGVAVSEPYDPQSVGTDDLHLSQGEVVGFEIVGDRSIAYQVAGIASEGELTIVMPDGALTDTFGNLGTGFTSSHQVDIGVIPFRHPAEPVLPLGSLIYSPSMSGVIAPDDADGFRIVVDPGQTMTVVLHTDESLRGSVTVRSGQRVLETAEPTSAADQVVLRTGPFSGRLVNREDEPTEFVVVVRGVDGTTGSYTLQLLLNAAFNGERRNDSQATALDLERAILPLASRSAERGAVLGNLVGATIAADDFVTQNLSSAWTTRSSSPQGRILVTGEFGTARGEHALLMDVGAQSTPNLNEAIWTVDLAGQTGAILSFSHASFSDERRPFGGRFANSVNADGVAISTDGTNWVPIFDAPDSPPGEWNRFHISLTDEAARAGLTLAGPLFIKFQQFDNNPLVTDGRGWDDIAITKDNRSDWYRLELDERETVTLAATAQTVDDVAVELYDADGLRLAEGLHIPRPVQNGGFETGSFAGWNTQTTGETSVPWQVTGAGAGTNFGIEPTSPPEGSFVAWNGFDGAGPMEFVLSQDVFIPANVPQAVVTWKDRIQWFFLKTGAAAKSYEVQVRDPQSGNVLESLYFLSTGPQSSNRTGDTGWQDHKADLSAYTGSTIQLVFLATVPESFTGPGLVEIDAVEIQLGLSRPTNVDDVIQNFRAPASGQYFARVLGTPFTEYSLLVTRNTEFDIEDNNSIASAQPIGSGASNGRHWVLGYVDTAGPTRSDFYQIQLSPGQPFTVTTFTPAMGSGEFVNNLDPAIRLLDATGSLVASDDNSAADGRNATLRHRVPRDGAGVYYLEITASSVTDRHARGEYILEIQGAGPQVAPAAVGAIAGEPVAAEPVAFEPVAVGLVAAGIPSEPIAAEPVAARRITAQPEDVLNDRRNLGDRFDKAKQFSLTYLAADPDGAPIAAEVDRAMAEYDPVDWESQSADRLRCEDFEFEI